MEFLGPVPCEEHQFVVYNDDDTTTDVCTRRISERVYKHHILLEKLSLSINIGEIDESSLAKAVITAAAIPSYDFIDCKKLGKINCTIDDTNVCIDENLQCDGDLNCGVKFAFDEDPKTCGVIQERIWLVMLFTFLFVTYNIFIFYRCLKKYITPIPEDFFIVDEKTEEWNIKPQLKICRSQSKDHVRISLSDPEHEPSDDAVNDEKIASSSREECLPSSSMTEDYEYSVESMDNKNVKFRRVRKKRWPVFTKAEVPPYEKRLSEKMKMKMIASSTSEDEKPRVTFFTTTTKLS